MYYCHIKLVNPFLHLNNIATFTVEEGAVGGAAVPLKTEPEFWDNIPSFDAVQELLHKKLSVSRLKAAQ